MKKIFLSFLFCFITSFLNQITNCLYFDFNKQPIRCYLDEFYQGSHVGISYKIWTKDNKNREYGNIINFL